jgi:hypothetical protein
VAFRQDRWDKWDIILLVALAILVTAAGLYLLR